MINFQTNFKIFKGTKNKLPSPCINDSSELHHQIIDSECCLKINIKKNTLVFFSPLIQSTRINQIFSIHDCMDWI